MHYYMGYNVGIIDVDNLTRYFKIVTCVFHVMCDFYYLDISLSFDESDDRPVSAVDFKQYVLQSIKSLFGEIGACINVDVLKYNPDKKTAILRCPSSSYVKLRSALTLANQYEGRDCCCTINNSSPLLISLVSNSRLYKHK